MKNSFETVVLCGAISPEREVSLRSGAACADALKASFDRVSLHVLDENKLPAFLDPATHVVMPVIHGDYGEDGQIQSELEARGFAFAGCDSAAGRICISKTDTKKKFREAGLPVAPEVEFDFSETPSAREIAGALGTDDVVIKPADKGSSVGLHIVSGEPEIAGALKQLFPGKWMVEPRIRGREMTIGILDGQAMGIVEIVPKAGGYDYKNKYTAGATDYLFPAKVPPAIAAQIAAAAERGFAACGCRDFARADFILLPDDSFVFLEINTMPGLTATSLLPKSASCVGLSFPELTRRMLSPAVARFNAKRKNF